MVVPHVWSWLKYVHIKHIWLCWALIFAKGIRAACAAYVRPKGQQVSLQGVLEEDHDALRASDQLPTPWDTPQPKSQTSQPIVSNTLFSLMDQEVIDRNSGQTWTAASGNPLFTVVDQTGMFNMEVLFCVCSNSGENDAQLLQSGLFPATFKQIETLFTVPMLDSFLRDNLECKMTAQQYYSKLQLMTNKMFPNNVPVCINSFIRAELTLFNRININSFWGPHVSGSTFRIRWRADSDTKRRGIIFQIVPWPSSAQHVCNPTSTFQMTERPCTSGKWFLYTLKTKIWDYALCFRDQLIQTFIMDENFSTVHMKHQSREWDVSLSARIAFMANADSYWASGSQEGWWWENRDLVDTPKQHLPKPSGDVPDASARSLGCPA